MENEKIIDAYCIEIKDPESEGAHDIYKFPTREAFYKWCLENQSDKIKIIAVTCAPDNNPGSNHVLLYSSATAEPITWDDLIGYLA